jgi:ElaB/YqjD/DUF883 family membrane-anchored ribosome-binding protein
MEKTRNESLNKSNSVRPFEEQIEEATYGAGKKVGQMASDISNTTTDYVKNSRAYVRSNPIAGVSIAATAGLMVGSLMTMAFSKRGHIQK